MTSSRISRLLVLCLLLTAGSAAAQSTTAPTVLTPLVPGGGTTGGDTTQPTAPGPSTTPATSGVEVDTLAEVTPDYGGTLEEGAGGFPIDMWRGTDRALVERLLPQLPAAKSSPAMRDLARRLLLTNAEAPAGRSSGVDLFGVRAERLAALGLASDAAALLALQPSRSVDPASARLRVDSLLLAGDVDAACKAVNDTRKAASADAGWQKAQIFCQFRTKQIDQAVLGLDLLREQGQNDPAFFALADGLNRKKPVKLSSLPAPTPLDLAMLRAAKLPIPEDAVQAPDPNVLAAIARDASVEPKIRLAAAEQAAAAGSLSIDQLRKAYTGITYAPGDLGNAIDVSAHDPGPGGRALLYQAAGAALQPAQRARILQAALDRARRQGGYLLAVQTNLIYLLPLTPSANLVWFAGDAGRALFASGHLEQANAWLRIAEEKAAGEPQAAAAVSSLAVYARIAGIDRHLAWDAATLQTWRQAHANDAPGTGGAARLSAVFEGLGEPIDGGWTMIGQANTASISASSQAAGAPDPALWFNLGEAAKKHRIGETVLLSLYALGPDGPAGANPILLSRAIDSLRQIGLDAEARAIATEAAIAAGA
ncbi:MAG: hypothetical protein QOK29_5020 [Rhodospirillaceae bacterium]|jgi:hypothetical protein|nr:hypothetical protein [Rhodospirillaceae bacterium]